MVEEVLKLLAIAIWELFEMIISLLPAIFEIIGLPKKMFASIIGVPVIVLTLLIFIVKILKKYYKKHLI